MALAQTVSRDVTFLPTFDNPTHAIVNIKVSKTAQFRTVPSLRAERADDPERGPVLALKHLFTCDPQPGSASLFNFQPDSTRRAPASRQGSPATRTAFVKLCNDMFLYTDVNSMHLKPHSFRQGGATALLAAGAPEHIIKTMGRWRSDCWQSYAFTDPAIIARWASLINAQHHHESRTMAQPQPALSVGETTR
jgi:integrase